MFVLSAVSDVCLASVFNVSFCCNDFIEEMLQQFYALMNRGKRRRSGLGSLARKEIKLGIP